MSVIAIPSAEFSAERRAQAVFKLLSVGAFPAAAALSFIYLIHHQRKSDEAFGRILADFASPLEHMIAADIPTIEQMTFSECVALCWAALVTKRFSEIPKFLAVIQKKLRDPTQAPAIQVRFVPTVQQDEDRLDPPGMPDLRTISAYFARESGASDQAVKEYDEVLEDSPYNWDALYSRALIHQAHRRHDAAARDLKNLFDRYTETGRGFVVVCGEAPLAYFPFTELGRADAMLRAIEQKFPGDQKYSDDAVRVDEFQGDRRMTVLEFVPTRHA